MAISQVVFEQGRQLLRASLVGDTTLPFRLSLPAGVDSSKLRITIIKENDGVGAVDVILESQADNSLGDTWFEESVSLSLDAATNNATQSYDLDGSWFRARVKTLETAAGYLSLALTWDSSIAADVDHRNISFEFLPPDAYTTPGALTAVTKELPLTGLGIPTDPLGLGKTLSADYIASGTFGTDRIAAEAITEPKLLISNAPANDQVLTYGPNGMEWTDPEAGGLDQSAVDTRVRALVSNWAEHGNNENIPALKLVLAQDQDARIAAGNAMTEAEEAKQDAAAANTLAGLARTDVVQLSQSLATHVGDNDAHGLAALRAEVAAIEAGGGGPGDDAFDWATVGNTDTIPSAKIPEIADASITEPKLLVSNVPGDGQHLTYDATNGLTWADAASGEGGGGAPELIGRGQVNDNHNNAKDTGINMPSSIADDDLFTVFIENRTRRQHSGTFTFSGEGWKSLGEWGVGQAEGNQNTFAMDQGDSTDDEYFCGKSGVNFLVSSDTSTNDDLTVSVFKHGGGTGGGGGTGLTPEQAARLLPLHTASQSDFIATSTTTADQWELSPRRLTNPVLADVGKVVGIVTNPAGDIHSYAPISLPNIGDVGLAHVGSIPPATSTSRGVLYLEHDHVRGVRSDATVTVGFHEGIGVYDSENNIGSIDKPSPVVRIYGTGNSSSYSVQDIVVYSATYLPEFTHARINNIEYAFGALSNQHGRYFRRVLNYPDAISGGTFKMNFRRPDGSYYFNDATNIVDRSAIYQKRELPDHTFLYNPYINFGDVHRTTVGPPTDSPIQGGGVNIDNAGDLWTAAGQSTITHTPATGAEDNFADSPRYVHTAVNLQAILAAGGNGAYWWNWNIATPGFQQFQGPVLLDFAPNRTWQQVFDYILTLISLSQAERLVYEKLQASIFLGRFQNLAEALVALQVRVEGGESFETDKFYYGSISDQRVKRITSFTAGSVTQVPNYHWYGKFATEAWADSAIASAIEAAALGGTAPTVLYESPTTGFTVTEGTVKLTGDIVCPSTGDLELCARALTGDGSGSRAGATAYARIPAAMLFNTNATTGTTYSSTNTNLVRLALGANREFSFANATADHHIQVGCRPHGNFYIRILHHA